MSSPILFSTSAVSNATGASVTTSAQDSTGCGGLIASVGYYNDGSHGTGFTLTDSKGNTWAPRTLRQAGNDYQQIFDCLNPTVGAGHTFTVTGTGGDTHVWPNLSVIGVATTITPTFDVQAGNTNAGTVTTLSSGSVAPALSGELVVSGINVGAGVSLSVNSGFTSTTQSYAGGGVGGGIAYLVQVAGMPVNPAWSWTTANAAAATTVVYKITVPNQVFTPADTRLYFSPGNWNSDGGGTLQSNNIKPASTYARTANCGAYVRIKMTAASGGSCVLQLDTSVMTGITAANCPQLLIIQDAGTPTVKYLNSLLVAAAGTTKLALGSGLTPGSHTFDVPFQGVAQMTSSAMGDRWNDPTTGASVVKILGVEIDAGSTLVAPSIRPNVMIALLDSIGEGCDAIGSSNNPGEQDATRTFLTLLASDLNAEYGIIAVSYQGYQQAGSGNTPNAITAFPNQFAGIPRQWPTHVDYWLDGLGTNGATSNSDSQTMAGLIRGVSTTAWIINLGTFSTNGNFAKSTGIANYVIATGDQKAIYVDNPSNKNVAPNTTDNVHPNFPVGHRLMAGIFLPGIRSGAGLAAPSLPAFRPMVTMAAGGHPFGLTTGDFNSDGKADLVVTNFADNTVGLFRGNGDGSFSTMSVFATTAGAIRVVAADLNGDGKLDLAIACNQSTCLNVLLGNGNGTFSAVTTWATGVSPTDLAVADLNGDGKPDLAVANYDYANANGTLGVLLNNGDGTFQSQLTFATDSRRPACIAIGDLNGDGKPDLQAGCRNYSGTTDTLLGNGNGTFAANTALGAGHLPTSIALGDLDRDGREDKVVLNQNGSQVSVFLGNGNGTYQAQKTYAVGSTCISVALADLNGDGILDMLVTNGGDNTLGVLMGNGDGTFTAQQTLATGTNPHGIAVADFTGDGKPDIAIANYTSGGVGVLLSPLQVSAGANEMGMMMQSWGMW